MALKLMYITNNPDVASIAQGVGVDRIFVDLEYIGKEKRQIGHNSVLSHHTIDDVKKVRNVVTKSELLVRINPIQVHSLKDAKTEIDAAIHAGADLLMLPYFKTAEEVKTFLDIVDHRVKTIPLVETPEAVKNIDEIIALDGIDELFVGLNDLSIGYNMKFLFELLCDGTIETLADKFKAAGIPFGFGGIASLGNGLLHSEYVIQAHYRLGSSSSILSRSFCNIGQIKDMNEAQEIFSKGVHQIREYEKKCEDPHFLEGNEEEVKKLVRRIVDEMK